MLPFDTSTYSFDPIAINAIVVWLIQQMKKSDALGFIGDNTPNATRLISAIGASLTAAGMSWTWNADGGVLTITGISAASVAVFGWSVAKNYLFQHVIYKAAFKEPSTT
ncbi:MAG: hypothetical protein E6Q97_09965 [Desulfurellales bacterium]|nr:MAG: hypothetical protein E6Q97_09965 [Desulfurellales bacterium]